MRSLESTRRNWEGIEGNFRSRCRRRRRSSWEAGRALNEDGRASEGDVMASKASGSDSEGVGGGGAGEERNRKLKEKKKRAAAQNGHTRVI